MKTYILIVFIFISFYGFSQSLEERDKITSEFKKTSDIAIELVNINSIPLQLDSILLKSNFLNDNNIEYRILAFKISGVDKDGKVVFFLKSWSNKIPQNFVEKLNECNECKSIKVDAITINWFTGTYTLNSNQLWNIK